MIAYDDIFDYIIRQEELYKQKTPINDKWSWSMKDHIMTTELYANSQLINGKGEFTPVKNITRPILNLQHRTEDIEVKDIELYVDDPDDYYLSLLVKKYHDDVFVVENDLDSFIDELNISRIDYGAGLSKKTSKPRPEVVPLQSIAFCDQTDMLSGPIGIKHYFSPDQLLAMESVGWGKPANGATIGLEELITLSRDEKTEDSRATKTPGRYIEIYEVHGNLPKRFASSGDTSELYETRLFIVAFYQKKTSSEKQGVILYTGVESESPFKLVKRDPVYGRALGFGGAEELFEPQVWVNYDMIRMQDMLDAASKTILHTTDPTLKQKHPSGLKNLNNLEILDHEPGTDVAQVDTFPRNIKLFEDSVALWEAHAQQMGAANDSIMGETPASGTPFKLQELVTNEAHGLHDYRRGQFAKHLEEIYRDWVIPYIEKQIVKGTTFLSELSLDDLQYVADALVTCQSNYYIRAMVLAGQTPDAGAIEQFKQKVRDEFKKKGTKHFIKILEGEFKKKPLAVKMNIAGKQRNLAGMVDKIVNIFRFAFSNPQGFAQVMQMPGMAKSFNEILEFSGLSPSDFTGMDKIAAQMQPQQPQPGQPPAPQNGVPTPPPAAPPVNA